MAGRTVGNDRVSRTASMAGRKNGCPLRGDNPAEFHRRDTCFIPAHDCIFWSNQINFENVEKTYNFFNNNNFNY